MSKTRGLILGKFAPFHIGHERLIEIAFKEVDEVTVIIYDCPNLTSISLNVRANWIRCLFPKAHVIEGWDAPNQHEDTPEVKRAQEEYVKKVLNGKKITHFFSSEYYGEHMSKFLGAKDRRVDRDDPRQTYITTATMIRAGKNLGKNFLSTVAYKDILIKVAFVGIPSQEQSKLVECIAEKLKTSYVEDNLHELLAKKIPVYQPDFYRIANKRYEDANSENKIFSGNEYMIYDSTGFIDHLLSVATHNKFDEKMFKFFSEDMRTYDLILANDTLKSSVSEYLNIDNSIFLNQLINNLNALRINCQILSGTFEEKLQMSEKLIKAIKKRFN